jgi:copper homeostasis protein (lipoprotein)
MDRFKKIGIFLLTSFTMLFLACMNNDNVAGTKEKPLLVKGLYSFGPEIKSFNDCEEGKEYWVADSAKTLELAYTNLGFEKPYTPVYVELECHIVKSDTATVVGDYDSTMVVTKLIKISAQIPDGPCSQ